MDHNEHAMTQQTDLVVRSPRADEFDAWAALFRAYREFYRLEPDETVVARVWTWIHDPAHETGALVAATAEERLVGFAHYRRFARPSAGSVGMYLDDLLTEPTYRGAGVGRALIEAITELAAREGCTVVRWITAEDNATAQRLYDSLATKTRWVTYDKPCP